MLSEAEKEILDDNTMVDYKIIKYCILCKKRFVVMKGQSRIRHCEECQKSIDNNNYIDSTNEKKNNINNKTKEVRK